MLILMPRDFDCVLLNRWDDIESLSEIRWPWWQDQYSSIKISSAPVRNICVPALPLARSFRHDRIPTFCWAGPALLLNKTFCCLVLRTWSTVVLGVYDHRSFYLPRRLMYSSSSFRWYFLTYLNRPSVPRTWQILTSWSRLLSPMKKGSCLKIWACTMTYHRCKDTADGPDVQRVVVIVVVNKQLWALEVSWSHSYVVVLSHVIEFS